MSDSLLQLVLFVAAVVLCAAVIATAGHMALSWDNPGKTVAALVFMLALALLVGMFAIQMRISEESQISQDEIQKLKGELLQLRLKPLK